MSIFFFPRTVEDYVINGLKRCLMQNPKWRKPFYGTSCENPLEILQNLQHAVSNLSEQDIANWLPVPSKEKRPITPNTRLQRDPGVKMFIEKMERQIRISVKNKQSPVGNPEPFREPTKSGSFILPEDIQGALEVLDSHYEAMTVSKIQELLPSLDEDAINKILEVLIALEFFRVLTFRPL